MATQLVDVAVRSLVVCISDVAPQLDEALRLRGLHADTSCSLADLRSGIPVDARAILVQYTLRLREVLLVLTDIAWQEDLLIIVLVRNNDERSRTDEVRSSVLSEDQAKYRRMLEEQHGLDVIDAHHDAIAEACARFRTGRHYDSSIGVDFLTPTDPNIDHAHLFRRAFEGYSKIRVQKLGGGYTECEVFRVEAWRGTAQCAPFVAKIGPHRDVGEEIGTANNFVFDHVPFPNHPPFIHDRCVTGSRKSVLVSRLVDHAHRLDTHFSSLQPSETARVMELLFEGAFRFWREKKPPVAVQLFDRYFQIGIIPEVAALTPAWIAAAKDDAGILAPAALIALLESQSPQCIRECLGHGDLQVRNIFVRHHPLNIRDVIDVVAIDFAKSGVATSAARDLTTLEVSIALDELDGLTRPTWSDLLQLYRTVLGSSGCRFWRWMVGPIKRRGTRAVAVRAIRQQAAREGIPRQEYLFSLIAHLLRYSRFNPQPIEMRALAYRAAALLARQAQFREH